MHKSDLSIDIILFDCLGCAMMLPCVFMAKVDVVCKFEPETSLD